MRSILFKLSEEESDDLLDALYCVQQIDLKITTPRKLFLYMVAQILKESDVYVEPVDIEKERENASSV